MNEQKFGVFVARTPEGKSVVASCTSPYFLFEADSETEALAIARRALTFYISVRSDFVREKPPLPGQSFSRLLGARRQEIMVAA